MARSKVVVTGDRKIDRMLRKLGDEKLAKSIVRKSMRSSLKPIVAAARANTPADSGAMRRAIKIVTVRTRKGLKLAVSILPKNLRESKPGQAAAVEFGTEDQDAQTPMKRAYDAGATTARDQCLASIRAGVLAAAK